MAMCETALGIVVRRATAVDVAAIYEITRDSFALYQRELGLPGKVAALKEMPEDILRDLKTKMIWLACVDGEDCGALRLEILGDIGYISRFGVKTGARGGGVGTELMAATIEEAERRGLLALALHTSTRMYGLMSFYSKNRFFVHSTTFDRGYVRGLLLRDVRGNATKVDITAIAGK